MSRYIDADKLLSDELTHRLPAGFGELSGKRYVFAEKLKTYYNELSGKTFPPLVAYHIEQIEKEFLCDSET